MSPLTNDEKAFLRELQYDPRWKSILDKVTRAAPAPYKPRPEVRMDETVCNWAYESGRYRENFDIVGVLRVVTDG